MVRSAYPESIKLKPERLFFVFSRGGAYLKITCTSISLPSAPLHVLKDQCEGKKQQLQDGLACL